MLFLRNFFILITLYSEIRILGVKQNEATI